jgi:hypothetical protein
MEAEPRLASATNTHDMDDTLGEHTAMPTRRLIPRLPLSSEAPTADLPAVMEHALCTEETEFRSLGSSSSTTRPEASLLEAIEEASTSPTVIEARRIRRQFELHAPIWHLAAASKASNGSDGASSSQNSSASASPRHGLRSTSLIERRRNASLLAAAKSMSFDWDGRAKELFSSGSHSGGSVSANQSFDSLPVASASAHLSGSKAVPRYEDWSNEEMRRIKVTVVRVLNLPSVPRGCSGGSCTSTIRWGKEVKRTKSVKRVSECVFGDVIIMPWTDNGEMGEVTVTVIDEDGIVGDAKFDAGRLMGERSNELAQLTLPLYKASGQRVRGGMGGSVDIELMIRVECEKRSTAERFKRLKGFL